MDMRNWILLLFCLCATCGLTRAQEIKNTSTEVKDYREVDGKIIVEVLVNGKPADFVLDLSGGNAVLPEFAEDRNLPVPEKKHAIQSYLFKNVEVVEGEQRNIEQISFDNNAAADNFPVLILKDADYIRKLGAVGVINGKLFSKTCFTIDSKRKKITTSNPYKPSYMKLENRKRYTVIPFGCGLILPTELNGTEYSLLFDTWSDDVVMLTPEDFAKLPGETVQDSTCLAYARGKVAAPAKKLSGFQFMNEPAADELAVENPQIKRSMLGGGLLKRGMVTIDIQRARVYFQPFDEVAVVDDKNPVIPDAVPGKMNEINREYFLKHVYDYKTDKSLTFKGDKPVVIDFWATWCGPCMKMLPEMEKLAEKYKDQVIFLKVNADEEKELCNVFGINALPTFMFIPLEGKGVMEVGIDAARVEQLIQEHLIKK